MGMAQHTFNTILRLIAAGSLAVCLSVSAHEDHDHDHGSNGGAGDPQLEALFSLYRNIIEMTPRILHPDQNAGVILQPRVRVGGMELESTAFHELVLQAELILRDTLNAECNHCGIDSDDVYLQKAKNFGPQGFIGRQITDPVSDLLGSALTEGADYGGEGGAARFVATAAFEAAETAIGAHFLCKPFQIAFTFFWEPLRFWSRAFAWAPAFDENRAWLLFKAGWFRSVAKRVERRVRFVKEEPVEIDEEALKQVNSEGPKRFWVWATSNRAKWLKRFLKKDEQVVDSKEFLGKPYKSTAFILSRRGSTYMKGTTPQDKQLNKPTLWTVEVQAMAERALRPVSPATQEEAQDLAAATAVRSPPPPNEIRQSLAYEYAEENEEKAQNLDLLLYDIEQVFDANAKGSVRRYRAEIFENYLNGMVYDTYKKVINKKAELFNRKSLRGSKKWNAIFAELKYRYKMKSIKRYINAWTDFLNLAARSKTTADLGSKKYEAMEGFLKLWHFLEESLILLDAETRSDLDPIISHMTEERDELETFTPWTQKRNRREYKTFLFIPYGLEKVRCEDLSHRLVSS